MKLFRIYLPILFAFVFAKVSAQLSPGDLSRAHADLEGMSNCTKCHVLGQKVSNDKCLSCHQEIKSRIDRRIGYHSSREAIGKNCASCHSDHHGRNFDMVHFDEARFNHNLAGYELTGAHKRIDCRECHKPDFVDDRELKKRGSTFLGLDQQCLSCHSDYHQKTLSTDCARCHDTNAFTPATRFNHDKTDFALAGKHKTVACIECHRKENRDGQTFQQFTGIAFSNCNSCHEDVHGGNLGGNCRECHSEQSFTLESSLKNFNHNRTHFPLKGKHQQINCSDCHNLNASPLTVFQDRLGVATDQCVTCHADVHERKFGSRCADCHREESFRMSTAPPGFNHSLTGYALTGKHQPVDCRKCHTTRMVDPLPHNTCAACHSDYHQNQFATPSRPAPDCAACHSVDGFENSRFTITDHQKSRFPLEGAHAATPCFVCHQQDGGRWNFRGIGERCIDCHDDVHGGEIAEKFYPNQSCERCHLSTSWNDSRFDHSLTAFSLAGAHAKQQCSACHQADAGHPHGKFQGLSSDCTACHDNVHYRQFDKDGVTDCLRCHGLENWKIDHFNHNKTAFKLTGKHVGVACAGCHKKIEENGQVFVQYKFKSFECVVCHR